MALPTLSRLEWLESEFSDLRIALDETSGLLAAVSASAIDREVRTGMEVRLTTGGTEERGPLGGIVYPGAERHRALARTGPTTTRVVRGARVFEVPVRLGGWAGRLWYRIADRAPRLTAGFTLASEAGGVEDVRGAEVVVTVDGLNPDWIVNIPGNKLRPGLNLGDCPESTPMTSIGSSGGSIGVVALSPPDRDATLVVWPRSLDEPGESVVTLQDTEVSIAYDTMIAAAGAAGVVVEFDGVAIDLVAQTWDQVAETVPEWVDDLGIRLPHDAPQWTQHATIYEVQIGTSLFQGGAWSYQPYPDMAVFYEDLERIKTLGFDTIQLMPRQPFPSYNVIDYDDIDASYGHEADLKRVVTWCHQNGMRVILDVLLHGVIDQESISEAAEAVRRGPWADFVGKLPDEIQSMKLNAEEQRDLSWSRHIIDFEDAWMTGSPVRHPLCEEHPEWFCRDSSGKIIGIYTKSFDMSNPRWHDYFTEKMVMLVERLGIDGFRFDAPTYNRFPNWSDRTRSRASLQQLGSVQLFRKLRARLHALRPDLMMYTEPNGVLLRQSMDLNYNYDETWLPASLYEPSDPRYRGGVHSGRDLSLWLRDRERTLPPEATTAHHIDSHDTFWWPLPGYKWRREQFGASAAAALMSTFALSGGPYMMFVGGEEEITERLGAVNSLRNSRAEFRSPNRDFHTRFVADDTIFTVAHRGGPAGYLSIVLVNLSAEAVRTPAGEGFRGLGPAVVDLLDGRARLELTDDLLFEPYQARFLVVDEEV